MAGPIRQRRFGTRKYSLVALLVPSSRSRRTFCESESRHPGTAQGAESRSQCNSWLLLDYSPIAAQGQERSIPRSRSVQLHVHSPDTFLDLEGARLGSGGRDLAHLIPISSGSRSDLVWILLRSTFCGQSTGTTSASDDTRQPKAGSFPYFGEFSWTGSSAIPLKHNGFPVYGCRSSWTGTRTGSQFRETG